LKVFAIYCVS